MIVLGNLAGGLGGLCAGLAGWWLLSRVARGPGVTAVWPWMIGLGLLLRVAMATSTPDFYAPDEQAHFNYVKYLAEHRSLPVQTSMTNAATNDWEYYQPPLYYLAQVPIYLTAQAIWGDVHSTVLAMRLLSVALWCVSVWAAWRFVASLGSPDSLVGICVFSMACFLPTHVYLSAMINNDNMVLAIGAWVLVRISQGELSWRSAVGTGLLLGLAALSKFSAIIHVVALVAVVGCRQAQGDRQWAAALRYLGVVAAVCALLVSPWIARNLIVYGSATAEAVANVPYNWNAIWQSPPFKAVLDLPEPWSFLWTLGLMPALLIYAVMSFWAAAGIYNNVYGVFPHIGLLLSLAFTRSLWRQWRSPGGLAAAWPPGLSKPLVLGLSLALLVNALLVIRFGFLYQQGQGRFFLPMLMPIGVFMALAIRPWRLACAPVHVGGFFLAYACAFVGFCLASFPHPG